jgi:ABC-type amino acid transport substrate-binding protein
MMNAVRYQHYLRWTFCWLLLLPALCLAAAVESVTLVYAKPIQQGDSSKLYQVRLLSAALQHAGIVHQLVEAEVPMVQDRSLRTVAVENGIDVFWSVTTIEREQLLTPVRFPIDKGLFGWRLLLLSPQTAAKTPDLTTLAGLKRLVFTQGHDWPDTDILHANRLKVLVSNQYHSMFEMLASNRVDAFPRSVLEIWRERSETSQPLPVEPGIVLHYPTALYYFFSPRQQHLAQQVELGLERMLQNGEFERMFQQEFAEALKLSKLDKRQVIELRNPLLPAATPLHRAELWFQLPK